MATYILVNIGFRARKQQTITRTSIRLSSVEVRDNMKGSANVFNR